MEGSWVGCGTQAAFRAAGYDRVCRRYNVPFVDLQKDSTTEYDCKGMRIRLCDQAMAADYMVNMPVLKGHCQTVVTCALKNNKGIIPNSEKRRFHSMGLHKPIAHLNVVAPNSFILVDNICGDLDFEEGGNPVQMDRVLGFKDPVLCDAYVCDCMGYTIDDVLVHDAHCESNFLHQMLAKMDGTDLPVALGVIRAVEAPTYETAVAEQVEEAKAKHGFTCLHDVIMSGDTWEVK